MNPSKRLFVFRFFEVEHVILNIFEVTRWQVTRSKQNQATTPKIDESIEEKMEDIFQNL